MISYTESGFPACPAEHFVRGLEVGLVPLPYPAPQNRQSAAFLGPFQTTSFLKCNSSFCIRFFLSFIFLTMYVCRKNRVSFFVVWIFDQTVPECLIRRLEILDDVRDRVFDGQTHRICVVAHKFVGALFHDEAGMPILLLLGRLDFSPDWFLRLLRRLFHRRNRDRRHLAEQRIILQYRSFAHDYASMRFKISSVSAAYAAAPLLLGA